MFQAGPLEVIMSLGIVAKVVLSLLLCFSVVSWAIILYKWHVFHVVDREDRRFMAVLSKAKDLDEISRHAHRVSESPCVKVYHGVIDRLHRPNKEEWDPHDSAAPSMAVDRYVVEKAAAHVAQGQIVRLEALLPFLATTGNISPFVGLLGTVVGIIDSFREIGAQGTASIAAVAPGVSEALIATAAGLFAAIPAVIAYNYFLGRIRRAAFRMDAVVVEVLALLSAKSQQALAKPQLVPWGAKV
ncbi:MAG: MotA/TolQ/ExbB proton channel family protein [Nitrospira sp.]|nr:MotA/TolQ/ExbB proton channel family protein [Nitrospira sp.]MCP9465077.1 MotA/TolQ/ExbB proton channel family protein [Nitrospira sp.]